MSYIDKMHLQRMSHVVNNKYIAYIKLVLKFRNLIEPV